MAKRRTRTKTPPRNARGVVAWIGVLMVAGLIGWVWWRAAYRPAEGRGGGGWWPVGRWVEGWSAWKGRAGEDEAIEEMPAVGLEEAEAAAEAVRFQALVSNRMPVIAPPTVVNLPTQSVVRAAPVESGPIAGGVLGGGDAVTNRVELEVPEAKPPRREREGSNVLSVQLALARRGFSAGPIDGVIGSQTRAALRGFQRSEGLPVTGVMDERTVARLRLEETPMLTNYLITAEDLARLTWVPSTWLGKASRERLDYETVLEMVAEKSHTHPKLLRQLNPLVNWNRVQPGTVVRVPAAELPVLRGRAGFVRISLSEKALRVFDPGSNLVAHFPCSIARKVEKRPLGELKVVRLAPNPNYRFDPAIFPESAEARKIGKKLMIPPGPNNPVGTAWIGLDRPGYGIHGTPNPEDVGRTESHGCFRLANWNAEFLMRAAWVGMPVVVER